MFGQSQGDIAYYWIVNEKGEMLAGPFSEKINADSELLAPYEQEDGGGPGYYHQFGEPKVVFGTVDWNTKLVTEA